MAKTTKRGQDDVGVGKGSGKKTVYRKPREETTVNNLTKPKYGKRTFRGL